MPALRDLSAVGATAAIALVAGAMVTAPTAEGDVFAFSPDPPAFPFDSTPAAIALSGLVALIVLAISRRVAFALAAVGAGSLILLAASFLGGPPSVVTVGAGAAIGGVVALAPSLGTRRTLTAVVGGFAVGSFAVPSMAHLRRGEPSTPRRYADYLPSNGTVTTFAGDRVLVASAVLAIVATVALFVVLRQSLSDPLERSRPLALATAAVSAVAGALAFWWYIRWISGSLTDATGLHTFLGGHAVAALLIVVALVTPRRRGLIWLAAVAVVAAHGADGTTANGTVTAVVIAALVALGVCGTVMASRNTNSHRESVLVVGSLIALTLLTASQFLDGETSELIPAAAGAFVIPVAVGVSLTAAVRGVTSPDRAVVIGALITLPLLARITGASVGWTAYTPLTDARGFDGFGGMSYTAATTTGVVSAVVTLSVCAVAAVVLLRRAEEQPD